MRKACSAGGDGSIILVALPATPQNQFTVSFFLPYRLHRHAPKPNNPDVYIQPSPAFTAFVAAKGGYVMDDWQITGMAKGLADRLDEAGIPYDTDSFFFAGWVRERVGGLQVRLKTGGLRGRAGICGWPADGPADHNLSLPIRRYDPPFRLTGRHQEVWLVGKEEQPSLTQA